MVKLARCPWQQETLRFLGALRDYGTALPPVQHREFGTATFFLTSAEVAATGVVPPIPFIRLEKDGKRLHVFCAPVGTEISVPWRDPRLTEAERNGLLNLFYVAIDWWAADHLPQETVRQIQADEARTRGLSPQPVAS